MKKLFLELRERLCSNSGRERTEEKGGARMREGHEEKQQNSTGNSKYLKRSTGSLAAKQTEDS